MFFQCDSAPALHHPPTHFFKVSKCSSVKWCTAHKGIDPNHIVPPCPVRTAVCSGHMRAISGSVVPCVLLRSLGVRLHAPAPVGLLVFVSEAKEPSLFPPLTLLYSQRMQSLIAGRRLYFLLIKVSLFLSISVGFSNCWGCQTSKTNINYFN